MSGALSLEEGAISVKPLHCYVQFQCAHFLRGAGMSEKTYAKDEEP